MNRNILEFVDLRGTRVIHEWLHRMKSRKERVSAILDVRLLYLQREASPGRPSCGGLHGPNSRDLFEIRISAFNVEYRPIFFYGPDQSEVALLAGATERDGHLVPVNV